MMKNKNILMLMIMFLVVNYSYSQEDLRSKRYQKVLTNAVQNGLPSITVMIKSANGERWYGNAGVKSIENNQPIDLNESYRLASITKLFTSVIILQLIDEKKLKLEDNISKYLDNETISKIPNINKITIYHLLSHSSGIYSFSENNKFWKHAFLEGGLSRTWTPTELINYIEKKKPVSKPVKPFSGFFYSNTNYILLGLIIENVTQNTLSSEYHKRIFEVLKMDNTFLEGYDYLERLPINTYAIPNWRVLKVARSKFKIKEVREDKLLNISDKYSLFNSWAWAAGGISSSISNLSSFLDALKEGVLLTENSQKIFSKLYTSKEREVVFFGGTGGSEGIQATMLYVQPQNVDIIILINSSGNKKGVNLGSVFRKLIKIASTNEK